MRVSVRLEDACGVRACASQRERNDGTDRRWLSAGREEDKVHFRLRAIERDPYTLRLSAYQVPLVKRPHRWKEANKPLTDVKTLAPLSILLNALCLLHGLAA